MKVGRLLEIGCASGAFIYKMASLGWDVEGIELSAGAANAARALGLNVHIGSVETLSRPARSYDLIVGWMVLEHLHDPVGVFKKLASWIDTRGWLVLSVPNANSLEFRLFKEKWYALQLPTHLYHFTPQTIRMVLERAGWRMERLFHQRVLGNFIASLGYQFEDSRFLSPLAKPFISFPENSGYWNYILYPVAYLLSTVGQTGRMTLWARKADD
jgi:2-polyprenyl-3-methyl-5-hydroxy-6-metoxy-1,4-benzoquinol methylase